MTCKVQPESTTCPLCLRVGGVQWRACGLNGEVLPNTFPTCRRCWITNMRRVGHEDSGEYLAPVLASAQKRRASRSGKYQARVRETYYGQVLATSHAGAGHRTQAEPSKPPARTPGKAGEASGAGGLALETYLSLDPLETTWEAVYARFGYRLPSSPYRAGSLPVYRGRAGSRRTRTSKRASTRNAA